MGIFHGDDEIGVFAFVFFVNGFASESGHGRFVDGASRQGAENLVRFGVEIIVEIAVDDRSDRGILREIFRRGDCGENHVK